MGMGPRSEAEQFSRACSGILAPGIAVWQAG